MYTSHYGLADSPFSIAPDPRYLFMSQQHREALAHLMYSIRGEGGFVLLTGEVGAGKTTLCRCFLEQLPAHCDVAFVINPKLTVPELLATLCEELQIALPDEHGNKACIDLINKHLLAAHAQGRTTLLIIDEAQNLSDEVLEQVRLLTNLETHECKLLHIILLGQPELRDKLARPELRQLSQRIVARYHLGPLQRDEIAPYIQHRLSVAGSYLDLFPPAVMRQLFTCTGGVPRKLNVLCDRALLGSYAQGKPRVDRATVRQAAREVFNSSPIRPWHKLALASGALLSTVAVATVLFYGAQPADQPPPAAATAARNTATRIPAPAQPAATAMPRSAAALARLPVPLPAAEIAQTLAYRTLLGQWRIPAPVSDEAGACQQAELFGARCLSGSGDLDSLRRLNLPAVLQLRQPDGQLQHLTLLALQGEQARVVIGQQPHLLTLAALAQAWNGRYTVLWMPPPHYQQPLAPGSRSLAVAWLRQQLGQLPAAGGATLAASYDAGLAARVRQFQLQHDLPGDGIAGPLTLIRLAQAGNPDSPHLSATAPVTIRRE
ncbi:peptidoglycan-binding protein [Vogesella sp. EB]|uniref:AAA family ATPase n=1 Tax=Vogesella sp. EB TaxID=1526735 RepID=UPI00064D46DF|nr:AAA family ATPase [Vogesella sp. EB]KMJ52277.1 peptidoglycan-binding protein [Vogesella sp. EB]